MFVKSRSLELGKPDRPRSVCLPFWSYWSHPASVAASPVIMEVVSFISRTQGPFANFGQGSCSIMTIVLKFFTSLGLVKALCCPVNLYFWSCKPVSVCSEKKRMSHACQLLRPPNIYMRKSFWMCEQFIYIAVLWSPGKSCPFCALSDKEDLCFNLLATKARRGCSTDRACHALLSVPAAIGQCYLVLHWAAGMIHFLVHVVVGTRPFLWFCPILQGGEVETLPKYGASQQTFKGSAREFERGSLKRYL